MNRWDKDVSTVDNGVSGFFQENSYNTGKIFSGSYAVLDDRRKFMRTAEPVL